MNEMYSIPRELHPSEPIRRGKWTPEEEQYAEKIIKFFKAGYMTGVDAGVTLRSYLSEVLHCDPMRVTKKFTKDSSVGKRVYLHSRAEDAPTRVQLAEEELAKYRMLWYRRLFANERIFLRKEHALPRSCLNGHGSKQQKTAEYVSAGALHHDHRSFAENEQKVSAILKEILPPAHVEKTLEWLRQAHAAISNPDDDASATAAAVSHLQEQGSLLSSAVQESMIDYFRSNRAVPAAPAAPGAGAYNPTERTGAPVHSHPNLLLLPPALSLASLSSGGFHAPSQPHSSYPLCSLEGAAAPLAPLPLPGRVGPALLPSCGEGRYRSDVDQSYPGGTTAETRAHGDESTSGESVDGNSDGTVSTSASSLLFSSSSSSSADRALPRDTAEARTQDFAYPSPLGGSCSHASADRLSDDSSLPKNHPLVARINRQDQLHTSHSPVVENSKKRVLPTGFRSFTGPFHPPKRSAHSPSWAGPVSGSSHRAGPARPAVVARERKEDREATDLAVMALMGMGDSLF